MAHVLANKTILVYFILFIFLLYGVKESQSAACKFPEYYDGSWYHREGGVDTEEQVTSSEGLWGERECIAIYTHPSTVTILTDEGELGRNSTILVKTKGINCYMCIDVIYRSKNILQFVKRDCLTEGDINKCPGMTSLPGHDELITMFNQKITPTDCISSIEGRYQFSYEVSMGGGGICNSSKSILEACQTPSSPNYDNKDFQMTYSPCKNLGYKRAILYKCMGSWIAKGNNSVYNFMAIANNVEGSVQERYKCLIMQKDQRSKDNTIRWGLSRYGDCRLTNPDSSPYQIVLRRVPPATNFLTPQCRLPRNLTGFWYTQGKQFSSDVWINETHIQYKTLKNQFDYEETWFSCQQMLGTRYLMSKIVVGRCEINYVCYDIMPRHHGIVRYRVGRPVRLQYNSDNNYDMSATNQERTFREACSWQWITFQRDNVDWKYEVLIQNPPSPTICPIGGRYHFTQNSDDFYQKYETRIRGVTLRPRVRINCQNDVSEFKSCTADSTRLEVDASYCETVDYRGRPIGEYEEPDHYLTCAGYWLEDMKSYLITYDEEDAISMFRCWVYERLSWTEIAMSRSETARCPRQQNSTTYQLNGARFSMILAEQERLFDECPPRFDTGINPFLKPLTMFRLDGAASSLSSSVVLVLSIISLSCLLV